MPDPRLESGIRILLRPYVWLLVTGNFPKTSDFLIQCGKNLYLGLSLICGPGDHFRLYVQNLYFGGFWDPAGTGQTSEEIHINGDFGQFTTWKFAKRMWQDSNLSILNQTYLLASFFFFFPTWTKHALTRLIFYLWTFVEHLVTK